MVEMPTDHGRGTGGHRVTTVVMTRNRWTDLQRSLPHHEGPVVVVDNGSSDGTPEHLLETFPWVEVVALTANRGAAARNVGVHLAETPYVAFADDDSWWTPGSLDRAAQILDDHPEIAVVAGRVVVGEQGKPDPVCQEMADSPLRAGAGMPWPAVLGFLACGAIVRKDAFLAVGGFDELLFFRGEEELLALDLASNEHLLVYAEELTAQHMPSPSRHQRAVEVQEARNRLLTAIMRRPRRVVLRTAAELVAAGPTGWAALGAATARAGRAIRRRRKLPEHVESARAALDEVSPPLAS